MTAFVRGDTAARLASLAYALDLEADRIEAGLPPRADVGHLVGLGQVLAKSMAERGETTEIGRPVIDLWFAAAMFARSWARHEQPEKAAELERWAQVLDSFVEAAIALGNPT